MNLIRFLTTIAVRGTIKLAIMESECDCASSTQRRVRLIRLRLQSAVKAKESILISESSEAQYPQEDSTSTREEDQEN